MTPVPTNSLLTLLDPPVTDGVVDRWMDYLNANTIVSVLGLAVQQAERIFLLEQLSLSDSLDDNMTLWDQYMDQEGYTTDSIVQAVEDWLAAGGVNAAASDITWDMNNRTWDSGLITFDGNEGT